ncbi:rab3 GTPase-activating protein catalytic subunit [Planoprotostelium fungivorum]|uniref:Rab3 GTPase-activating protein catalytic subunit n=1 Tax=Planoprotostelium fungivorum TaxID=1890364 RepID=A0A2P6P0R7_9EUKA|nr:rab3 GTPase-activating protein catalytic subunit [Planoprotostelium fungivorum]
MNAKRAISFKWSDDEGFESASEGSRGDEEPQAVPVRAAEPAISDEDVEDITDKEEPFEIVDYTSVTPWEKLVSSVEQLLNQWWIGETDEGIVEDNVSERKNYNSRFGVKEYIIVTASDPSESISSSMANTLLSVMAVAYNNILPAARRREKMREDVRFTVPCFVAVGERWQGKYLGWCNNPIITPSPHLDPYTEVSARFDADSLSSVPDSASDVEGLLSLFLQRIDQISSIYTDCAPIKERFGYHHPVTFSSKFTFMVTRDDLQSLDPKMELKASPNVSTGRDGAAVPTGSRGIVETPKLTTRLETNRLLWYPPEDPIETLDFGASWHFETLHECLSVIRDGVNVSDEQVLKAPRWDLRCVFDEKPSAFLSQRMHFLCRVAKRSESYNSIGKLFASPPASVTVDENEMSTPTEPQNYVHSVNTGMMNAVNVVTRSLGPEFLESEKVPSITEVDTSIRDVFGISPTGRRLDRNFTQIEGDDVTLPSAKGAPPRSLLAFFLVHLLNTPVNLKSLGLLWGEFVRESRVCWESKIPLPNVKYDRIDLRSCLIHQKLQLLNYCIQNAENKEEAGASSEDEEPVTGSPEKKKMTRSSVKQAKDTSTTIPDTYCANGRPMMCPNTQTQGLMTEDMLMEQEEIFFKLGDSEEGQRKRAVMQSSSLVSDMQSFKAANAGAQLVDFIRWHSPRDFIEEQPFDPLHPRGDLSVRMKIPGNLWQTCWDECEGRPPSQQKPLFHSVREAEKILHYMETINPSDLTRQLIAVGMTTVYGNLTSQPVASLSPVRAALDRLNLEMRRIDWSDVEGVTEGFEGIKSILAEAEMKMYQAKSLSTKLPNEIEMVSDLMEKEECKVHPTKRLKVLRIFTAKRGRLPAPDSKEFVLRNIEREEVETKNKRRGSVGSQQEEGRIGQMFRLYSITTDIEFRVAFASVVKQANDGF